MLLGAPAGLAIAGSVEGFAHTSAAVEGSGEGELRHLNSITRWWPEPLADGHPATFVKAPRVVVYVKEETYTRVDRLYSDRAGETKQVAEFRDVRLDLVKLGSASRIGVAPTGPLESFTSTAVHTVIHPPEVSRGVTSPGTDHRARFETWRAGDLELVQEGVHSRGHGDFEIMFENATFRIEASTGGAEYASSHDAGPSADPAVRRTTTRVYFVEVFAGDYDTSGIGGSARIRSNAYAGSLTGSFLVPTAHGEALTPDGPVSFQGQRLDLRGEIDLRVLANPAAPAEETKVEFRQAAAGMAPANTAPTIPAARTEWALPLSIGGALAFVGIGAAAFSPVRNAVRRGTPAARPAPQPAEPAAAEPASVVAMAEAAYRADPGNIQRAMELGLHYANENRHGDALPLLLMTVRQFPKSDVARYATALSLLHADRVEEAVRHLEYAFRLNPLNVARFLKEGAVHVHGDKPEVEKLINRWARVYHETNSRGYA